MNINKYLLETSINRFLADNYRNALRYDLKEVTLNAKRELLIEGAVTFKSGKTRDIRFLTDSIDIKKNKVTVKAISEAFTNSKAFKFTFIKHKDSLLVERVTYYYTTRQEGTPYQVSGSISLTEAVNKIRSK